MPIYESETITREELEKQRKWNVCAVCGGWLNMFIDSETGLVFLACNDWLRSHHEGIARENNELRELNIPTRRENMELKHGQENIRALAKYQVTTLITRQMAAEIVETLWKGAPPTDKTKAIILCATYNLNPLMNHLFMLPFKNKEGGKDWAIVIGIEATRLMAKRKHHYTYLDLTPRRATRDELEKILGDKMDPKKLYFITKLKDLDTGEEVYGLGEWEGSVYGTDKGNSPANMASIRSERQALKRQYPAEMPAGVDVVDERFIPPTVEGDYREVDETTGEIKEPPEAPETQRKAVQEETKGVAPKEAKQPEKPKRDPATIKTITDLQRALWEDFKLEAKQRLAELNLNSWSELAITPAEAYTQVAATRQ